MKIFTHQILLFPIFPAVFGYPQRTTGQWNDAFCAESDNQQNQTDSKHDFSDKGQPLKDNDRLEGKLFRKNLI